jgi:hypothetical protein
MKLQAAFEFLLSYGWAVLIVVLVLIGIYYIGIFSNKQINSNCVFPAGTLSCTNVYISQNGILTMDLVYSGTYPINVSGMGCNSDEQAIVTSNDINPPSNVVNIISQQSHQFSLQCYNNSVAFAGSSGGFFKGYISVYYIDTYTKLPSTAYAQTEAQIT